MALWHSKPRQAPQAWPLLSVKLGVSWHLCLRLWVETAAPSNVSKMVVSVVGTLVPVVVGIMS